jgi:HEAT repeat protein
MLPLFGPPGQKVVVNGQNVAGKVLLRAMEKEPDPTVRLAAYQTAALIGFADEGDVREAVRILAGAAERGATGGQTRYQAVVALAVFGHKAEPAVGSLIQAITDSAYETRRAIAHTLGQVAFHEHRGPSLKALNTLCTTLAKDPSAAVRMEAMHSVVLLGPPFQTRPEGSPLLKDVKDPKDAPKANDEAVKGLVAALRARITPTKSGKPPETEKPVEIWCRLALMRLDPKEVGDENLNAIARFLPDKDPVAKLQALTAFTLMGEVAAKRMKDVLRVLEDKNPIVVEAALKAIVAMGPEAKGAIPQIEALKTRPGTEDEQKAYKKWADDAILMIKMAKPPAEPPKKP